MSDKINLKTTDIICNNILTQIVEKGRKNIEDKKTIKKYLIPHTANVANLLTAKVSKQIQPQYEYIYNKTQRSEVIPQQISKDQYTSKSVPKILKNKHKFLLEKKTSIKNRKRGTTNYSIKGANSEKLIDKIKKITSFQDGPIKLPQKDDGRIKNKSAKERQQLEDEYRQLFNERDQQVKQQDLVQVHQNQQKNQHLQNQRKIFKRKTHHPNSSFSYDVDGKVLYFSKLNHQKSLKNKYPNSLSFSVVKPPLQNTQIQKESQRLKAARGQGFSSVILKTMNVSKISMNASVREGQENQENFMVRNDIFNNNHGRQTTSIPFLQIKPGATFTQTESQIAIKHQCSESEIKNQSAASKIRFKKFVKTSTCGNSTQANFFKNNDKEQRVTKTAEAKRERTTGFSRPKTGRTTGHITVNQNLMVSLLE